MDLVPIFRDRAEAGRRLAQAVVRKLSLDHAIVLALPRGGVPVALPVAQALNAELDIFIVRKLGVPGREELAFGAIASGGVRVLNEWVIDSLGIGEDLIEEVAQREAEELARREELYRRGRTGLDPHNRTVVLVDDGLATGASMLAAMRALRLRTPLRLIAAVPVASTEACEQLSDEADEMFCLAKPDPFIAVGTWFGEFPQVSDGEVRNILDAASRSAVRR